MKAVLALGSSPRPGPPCRPCAGGEKLPISGFQAGGADSLRFTLNPYRSLPAFGGLEIWGGFVGELRSIRIETGVIFTSV